MDERRISHYNIDKAIKKLGVTDFLMAKWIYRNSS